MKINMSDYFPVLPEKVDEFEKLVETSKATPPEGGFERLMVAKDSNEKLDAFKTGRARPPSFGMLVEVLANAIGKNRFRFADELEVESSVWNKVILGQDRPDTLPARIYAVFAKTYDIMLEPLRNAIEGSFQLMQSGISGSAGAVYARSDRKKTNNTDVTAAMHELLRKAGKTKGALDQKAVAFLREVESCMKT